MKDDDPKWIALVAKDKARDDKLKALKALDASQETGALKTIIEYLQR